MCGAVLRNHPEGSRGFRTAHPVSIPKCDFVLFVITIMIFNEIHAYSKKKGSESPGKFARYL
jgi:hypothetical protein